MYSNEFGKKPSEILQPVNRVIQICLVGDELADRVWNIEEISMYQRILVPRAESKQAESALLPRHEFLNTHMIIRESSRRPL